MKVLKRLILWFRTKKRIINELIKVNQIIEKKMDSLVENMEGLDQNKIYILVAEGETTEGIDAIQDYLTMVKKRMRWSSPEIIVMNKRLEVLTIEDTKLLISKLKKIKGDEKK